MKSDTLARNLAALSVYSPDAAKAIRRARPRRDVRIFKARMGGITGERGGVAMASRIDPAAEAAMQVRAVDVVHNSTFVTEGFGLGAFAAALAARLKGQGIIVIYEPDVRLLRSVFEAVDHSGWLAYSKFLLATDPAQVTIAPVLWDTMGYVVIGCVYVDCPTSRRHITIEQSRAYLAAMGEFMESARMSMVSAVVQMGATFRNLIGNMGVYVGV